MISKTFFVLASLYCAVKGDPAWAVPAFEIEFCPLEPPQPCPEYRINFVVNRADGPYTPVGGKDTRCRSVEPKEGIRPEWKECDDKNLQWRWQDFDELESSMSLWPRDVDGYTRIGIRQLSASKNSSKMAVAGEQVEGYEAELRFRETTEAGGRDDAVIGCAVYNPKWATVCSMSDLLIFGFDPPKPIILNVTRAMITV